MVMDDTFAFIIHPIDPQRDVARKYPALGRLPRWLIDFLSPFFPPVYISAIQGIQSALTGGSLRGWFVACPLTPARMMSLPAPVVYRKVIQAGRMAERLGARILGLGAFTAVVGDGGHSIARELTIPVTTGDSYTVAVAVQAVRQAAGAIGIDLQQATVAVVGAAGAIGAVCARLLGPDVGEMLLVGRSSDGRLTGLATQIRAAGCRRVQATGSLDALRQAQIVITVTSAVESIIKSAHLRPGAVVLDVARPRDVSLQVAAERADILVIEGGMVEVPGRPDFGFDFGFPPGMAYACMAETMTLALAGRYESFTLGKQVALEQVQAIEALAAAHGFRLGGFRSFERPVSEAALAAVRERARPRAGHEIPAPVVIP